MTTTAETLRLLHRIHRQLADLNERLDRGPRAIKAREANVARLETEVAAAKEKTTQSRMAADKKQLQLKAGEDKIVDLRAKLNASNSNREYQALLDQIAADEMANSVLEDEILEALDRIEQLQVAVGETEKNLAEAKKNLEATRQSVSEEAKLIKGDIARLEAEASTAEQDLPGDFRAEYDRLVRNRGDDALAAVEEDCCSGCYQQIAPNMVSQLMMDHVVCCKSCGRILYLPE